MLMRDKGGTLYNIHTCKITPDIDETYAVIGRDANGWHPLAGRLTKSVADDVCHRLNQMIRPDIVDITRLLEDVAF